MADKIIKEAIIKTVARTGGIKIEGEDDWYNPVGNAKDYVKPELKGKKVELTMSDDVTKKNAFSFIKVIPRADGPTQPSEERTQIMSSNDFWRNKENREINNSKRISRHGSLNSAIEIIKLSSSTVDEKTKLPGDILFGAEKLANEILEWVNKKDGNKTSK